MNGAGIFFLILFLLLLVYGAWVGYRIFNARKSGEHLVGWKSYVPFMTATSNSNYPTPRSAGPLEWVRTKIDALRNKRSQTGGYETDRGGVSGGLNRRGRDDDAWDARVDQDPYGHGPGGYYEEQELGLGTSHTQPGTAGPYGGEYVGSEYGHSRGRSDLDPFSDANAASLRSVSPRPDGQGQPSGHKRNETLTNDDGNTSPISTRKSIFREDVN